MPVVVTGAAGFLGSALVSRLVDEGEHVVAVDRRPVAPRGRVRPLRADLLDDDPLVAAALRAADAVWHLAGAPGVRDHTPDAAARRARDNVAAAAVVLDAVPAVVPLVVTSSSSVYGGSSGRPSRESDPLRPAGGYAASKCAVEALCRRRIEAGATVTVARPFTCVGEGQRPDMALSRWVEACERGRPVVVLGGLERSRDLTDVREAARGLVALGRSGFVGPVNLGTGIGVTLRCMVRAVEDAVGRRARIQVRPAASEEACATLADTGLLRATTGLELRTDLADAVRRVVERDRNRVGVPA